MQKTLTFLFSILFIFSLFLSSTESLALTPIQTSTQAEAVADLSFAPECVEFKNNLTFTDRDSFKNGEVTKLQNFLASQGYFKEPVTGYFGQVTTKAVAEFQTAQSISPAVGYVGPVTKTKIKALTCVGTVTPTSCPTGSVGTPPNCALVTECPEGSIGTYPDCKIASCSYPPPPSNCTYVQGSEYNAQTQCGLVLKCEGGDTTVSACVELSNNLILTDRDSNKNGEVTKLQKFLVSKGYLKENPTGYFGVATLAGVVKFQKENNISPAIGYVGSLTRAKIKALSCGDISVPSCPQGTAGVYPDCKVVDYAQPTFPNPDLKASSVSFASGGSTVLTWTTENSSGCTASSNPKNTAWIGTKATTGSQTISNLTQTTEFTLTCSGFGGSDGKGYTQTSSVDVGVYIVDNFPEPVCPTGTTGTYPNCVTTIDPKPTVTLTATPDSVQSGGSTQISWTTKNATVCTASGGWTGTKATSGSQVISNLQTTTTFNLSCVGIGGLTSVSTDVGVYIVDYFPDPVCPTGTTGTYPNCVTTINPIPTVSLTATPESVQNNQTTALTWTSGNATSCSASGGWTGTKATNGVQVISNLQTTTTFTLTCTGANGEKVSKSVDVGVYVVDNFPDPICPTGTTGTYPNCVTTVTPTPKPTVTITASPNTVPYGGSTTLSWTSTNATTCVASNSWSGSKNTSGTTTFGIYVNNPTTYSLSCTGLGGTTTASATVSVASSTGTSYPAGCTSNTGFSTTTGQSCSGSTTVPSDPSVDTTPRVSIWGGKVPQYVNAQGAWVSDLNSLTVHSREILQFCQKWYPSSTSYTTYKTEFIPNWVNFSTRAEEVFYSSHFSYKCVGGVQPTVLGASTTASNSCSISQTLMKGMNNDEVKCLQQKLNQKGYTVSGTEGGREVTQFGVATLSALRKFQAENGLTVDGILGLASRNKINQ